MKLSEVLSILENEILALDKAMPSDRPITGLIVPNYGNYSINDKDIERIIVSLDLTNVLLDKIKDLSYSDLIIVHHSLWSLFEKERAPIYSIKRDIKIPEKILSSGASVYVAHSAWDFADGGNFDTLANILALKEIRPLPLKYEDIILEKAVVVGKLDKTFHINELIEQIVNSIINKIKYYINNGIKLVFDEIPILYTKGKETINSVAVSTGAGDFPEFIEQLAALGIDAYVTGELRHEAMIISRDMGISVIGLSHYLTETLGMAELALKLSNKLKNNIKIEVIDPGAPMELKVLKYPH